MKAKILCGATHPNPYGGPDYECEREVNHKGKHDGSTGPTWNDAGAEIAREERRKKFEAEPF
jgi:hypothetical protein